jgi:hypothetical protein
LEHGEKLQGKCLILTVLTLAAVFLECAHHENVNKVQRLFRHFIEGVTFDEKHVFVGEVHMEMKREISVFKKGPLARWSAAGCAVVLYIFSALITTPSDSSSDCLNSKANASALFCSRVESG